MGILSRLFGKKTLQLQNEKEKQGGEIPDGLGVAIKILFFFWVIGIGFGTNGVEAFHPSSGLHSWAENLNLSPEQVQTIKDLNRQFSQELAQIRKNRMLRRMELRTLPPEEFRGLKGDEIRHLIRSLRQQARERALFFQQEAFKVLTPEQQKKVSSKTDFGFDCGGMFRGGRGMGIGRGNPDSGPWLQD